MGQILFLEPKIFWTLLTQHFRKFLNQNLFPKIFFDLKLFRTHNSSLIQKYFWTKIFFGQQILFGNKMFYWKSFLDQEIFHAQFFCIHPQVECPAYSVPPSCQHISTYISERGTPSKACFSIFLFQACQCKSYSLELMHSNELDN